MNDELEDYVLEGAKVRICGQRGMINTVRDRSCDVAVEIGGVHQDILVTKEYARENRVE